MECSTHSHVHGVGDVLYVGDVPWGPFACFPVVTIMISFQGRPLCELQGLICCVGSISVSMLVNGFAFGSVRYEVCLLLRLWAHW